MESDQLRGDATGEPLVLYGTSNPDSEVYAVDAITGALVWARCNCGYWRGDYDVGAGVVTLHRSQRVADGVAYVVTNRDSPTRWT